MAQIKVYRKNDKVLIELTSGKTFLGGADGEFVAENGTGSDQVNIKHAEGGDNFIIKNVRRGDIHDGATDTDIGSDRDTCVSLLNSNYFNRNAPINFEIFVKNSGSAASKGDLLELVSHDGDEKPICQKTANTSNNAVFMAMEDIASQGTGKATPLGTVTGLDTSGETVGDVIYVSDTGGFTTTKPSTRRQPVGYITKVDASDGEVFVNIGSDRETVLKQPLASISARVTASYLNTNYYGSTSYGFNYPIWTLSYADSGPYGNKYADDYAHCGILVPITCSGVQVSGTIRNDSSTDNCRVRIAKGSRPNGGSDSYVDLTQLASQDITIGTQDRHYNVLMTSTTGASAGDLLFFSVARTAGTAPATRYYNFSVTITLVL